MAGVVLYCLFEAVDSVRSRGFLFESELITRSGQMRLKNDAEGVFKHFTHDRGNRNSPIVIHITQVALPILDNRDYSSTLELNWNETVKQHLTKEVLYVLVGYVTSVKGIGERNHGNTQSSNSQSNRPLKHHVYISTKRS